MVKEIKNINDFREAIGNTGLVIIDFFAKWCRPCMQFTPKLEKMAEKYSNVGFYKINVDTEDTEGICSACDINLLPTFCLFVSGVYVTKMTGADDAKLEKLIIENLPKNVVVPQDTGVLQDAAVPENAVCELDQEPMNEAITDKID